MHKHDPTNLKPCKHMETLVSAMVDGRLSGFYLWFTKVHVKGCTQCSTSLPFLGKLKARVEALAQHDHMGEMPTERWSVVEKKWDEAEASQGHSPSG
jgi:hypothetical protein